MKGLIVVVNFEQAKEIGAFLERLDNANPGLEVIVVDDGSKDRSPAIAEEKGYTVLRHEHNLGVGAAIRTGVMFARSRSFDYIVIMSSNGKMHPEELPSVIAPIESRQADYVQGSRFLTGGSAIQLSAFRSAAIPAYSLLASALLGVRFTDITCGFRAYLLSIFDDPAVDLGQAWLNRYEAEIYIHYQAWRQRRRIIEVPVTIDYSHLDEDRKSKMRPFVGWWSLFRPFFLLKLGLKH
jgi:glycosyltransferase involved in cell wall biosynthesis